jgi:hypothetical protein
MQMNVLLLNNKGCHLEKDASHQYERQSETGGNQRTSGKDRESVA